MNERISQLSQQAGEACIPFMDYRVKYMIFEKFAELLIKECADWINENVGLVSLEARQDLYKHFGINE